MTLLPIVFAGKVKWHRDRPVSRCPRGQETRKG